mgnify:CR=1 FL=1
MYKEKTIIVGNGTSILDYRNGNIIDSFGTVIRFNSFKIKGFEEYTGTKTDVWWTCNLHHAKEPNVIKGVEVIEHSWQWSKDLDKTYKALSKVFENVGKTERSFVHSIPIKASPSTGLIAIWHYVTLGKNLPIYITGFDWWDKPKEVHHYGDGERRGTLHKPEQELELIQNLAKENKVKFL